MVGTLAGLQLRLYARALRRSTGAMVAAVIAAVYAVGILAGVLAAALALRTQDTGERAIAVTAVMGAVCVMRVFALFVTGQDQSLDPARFALLPVAARRLQPGLLVAAFCTPGPWFLVALVALSGLAWSDRPALMLLTWLCGLLGLVCSTLLCRCLVGILSGVLHTRRFRDLAGVVVTLLAMSIGVLVQALTHALGGASTLAGLHPWGRIVGWTPFGWSWALVGDVAQRHRATAAVRAALALAGCAVLWWAWGLVLARELTSPLEAGGSATSVRSTTLVDRICPQTPAGAIAARTLRYYRRDPRHVMQLAVMVVLPVLMVVPNVTGSRHQSLAGLGRTALVVPMVAGLMVGSSGLAQEMSLDGSALWTGIVAGVPGRSDRWGRLYAFALVATPLVVALDVVFALLTHQSGKLLVMVGSGIGALGASSAVGTVSGALVQAPQPPPGSSPFARGSGGGMVATLASLAGLLVSGLLVAPFGITGWLAWERPVLMWLPLALALVLVPLLCWAACLVGGRILDRSWPEVLQRVTWEK